MLLKVAFIVGIIAVGLGILQFYYNFLGPSCHSSLKEPSKHMATKSPYVHQDNVLYNFEAHYKPFTSYIPPGCSAEKIWLVARHGTRNPGTKIINKILHDIPLLRDEIVHAHSTESDSSGQLCESELSAIKSWTPQPDLAPSKEKWLVPQGYVELHGIAQRLQKSFPDLISTSYDPAVHKFKFTKTQRAEASAKSFVYGLFGDEAEKVDYPPALHADPILRFYKACPKWKKDVDKNPAAYEEKKLFEKSQPFQQLMDRVNKRLGLQRPLSVSDIEIMYLTCSFETAWHPHEISPWCGVFDEEDFAVLEYRQDLEYYWVDGYGYEITHKHACAPIRDVIQQFNDKVERPDDPHRVTAYFTHSGTLLKFLSHLGLFRDTQELRADNFHLHKSTRKWRTSFIDKFATNIAFILFKCTNNNNDDDDGPAQDSSPTYKIGVTFQEHVMPTEFCGGDWICSFDQFMSYFNDTVTNCNVDLMCKL